MALFSSLASSGRPATSLYASHDKDVVVTHRERWVNHDEVQREQLAECCSERGELGMVRVCRH